jgi:glutamine synthetase
MNPVDWIRLGFVDVFGTANSVLVPGDRWDDAVAHGVLFDGSAIEGRARVFESDLLLRPVPSTLFDLGDGTARVVCEVSTPTGVPWAGDPRVALTDVVERVGPFADVWMATAELECYVLSSAGEPVDRGFYFDDVDGVGTAVVRAAADLLRSHGIGVSSCHHEAGPGQYEIDLSPLSPVALADALVMAKQAVREQAAALGVRATFMPRPFDGEAGSGLHLHQRAGDRMVSDDGKLDDDGRAVVGGVLAHAGGLCALAAPTVNSYKRLHGTDEAPRAAMWGYRHRAGLLRVGPAGIEYRGADPSANPYLLVAGLLLAAADGLDVRADPGPPQDESVGGFDASLESVRERPLPRTLDEALDAFLTDDVLLDGFDSALVQRLIDGRRAEAAAYGRHVTQWERDRYLDDV